MTTSSVPYVSQLPGELNLRMVEDNDLVFTLDFNTDLTDYTFSSNIIPDAYSDEIAITVTETDIATGVLTIKVTKASIANLAPSINRWYFNWTTPAPDSLTRTILSGSFVIQRA